MKETEREKRTARRLVFEGKSAPHLFFVFFCFFVFFGCKHPCVLFYKKKRPSKFIFSTFVYYPFNMSFSSPFFLPSESERSALKNFVLFLVFPSSLFFVSG